MKRLAPNIAFAVLLLAGALAFKYAQRAGLVGPDTDGRAMQVIIGLTLVFIANFIPKNLRKWRNAETARRAQIVARVAGWSMMLAGLAYAALWAFAPVATADPVSMTGVAAAVAITFGFTVWACGGRAKSDNEISASTSAHSS
jgi:hypothetical protein